MILFFIGQNDSQSCKINLTNFLYLCKTIGVPNKMSETQTSTITFIIYGIEFDSCKMEALLSVEKVDNIRKYL